MKKTLPLIAIAFLLLLTIYTPALLAQSSQTNQDSTQTPAPAQENKSQASDDLEIRANVTASELRFEVVPNPDVKFTGKPERNTVWEAERENLPAQVQPGVTYRNIGIRLKIVSRFADIDRIVSEALGETPVTDDIPAPSETPQPAQASPSSSPAQTTAGEGRPQ